MPPTYFTSDQHLGHSNIIKFCNRPFDNVEAMTETLLANHNSLVNDGDSVYHLGDLFWKSFSITDAMSYMSRAKGIHYRIRGNHDELFDRWPELRSMFRWSKDLTELKLDGYPKLILCHYALREWHSKDNGSWHLFGHSHGQLKDDDTMSMDVGVDACNYHPVSIESVAKTMRAKQQRIDSRDLLLGDW